MSKPGLVNRYLCWEWSRTPLSRQQRGAHQPRRVGVMPAFVRWVVKIGGYWLGVGFLLEARRRIPRRLQCGFV